MKEAWSSKSSWGVVSVNGWFWYYFGPFWSQGRRDVPNGYFCYILEPFRRQGRRDAPNDLFGYHLGPCRAEGHMFQMVNWEQGPLSNLSFIPIAACSASDAHPGWPEECLWNPPKAALARSHAPLLSKPQRIGFVPIYTLVLDLTAWNGISKVHCEQFGRLAVS